MISATSLNSTSTHSLSKQAQIPLGLENGRLRVDSQKFLVPSLPVSSRVLSSNDPSGKRRERSILNGTAAHPSDSHNHSSSNHMVVNGLRRSYNPTNSHPPPHQLHSSPRKDSSSLPPSPHLYNGESHSNHINNHNSNNGISGPGGGMPIPCSSPSPGASASPNKSHSPSSSSSSSSSSLLQSDRVSVNGAYQPGLPPGLSEFAAASRLYPGGVGFHGIPGHHAAHLSPHFYAAASHSLPYPLFGATYNHLDNFHPNLLTIPQMRSSLSPSPPRPPPSSYLPPPSPQQQQQQHSPHLPQTTSTTSLHNQLIESVGAGERYNGHNHNHMNNHALQQQQQQQHHHHHHSHHNNITSSNNNSRFSNGGPGVSKGGPLGIGNGLSNAVPNLPPPSSVGCQMSRGSMDRERERERESSSDKSYNLASNGGRNKVWIDLPSPKNPGGGMSNGNGNLCVSQLQQQQQHQQYQQHMKEMEMDSNKDLIKGGGGGAKSLKHYILTRSPDHLSNNNCVKNHKNHLPSSPNGLHLHQSPHHHPPSVMSNPIGNESSPLGILVESSTKLNHNNNNVNNNHSPFLPPSPKKRSGQWNFAVPNSKTDLLLPPPPPPQPHSLLLPPSSSPSGGGSVDSPSLKYLSNNTKNPSSNALTSNNSNCSGSSNSTMNHDSPKSPYLIPSSPSSSSSATSAQQYHFQFPNLKSTAINGSNSNSPQGTPSGNQSPAGYMSAPSTPTLISTINSNGNLGHKSKSTSFKVMPASTTTSPPIQVEQMPLIDAFRRGSLTQLPNGDRKPVEDLSAEDFVQAAAVLSDSISIVHCTVVNIESNNTECKVTLSTGSHNQQVIVDATAEQPFFVMGRGWCSVNPAKTEKKLQLSCTPLSVGDVCITLTRTPNPVLMATTSSALNMPAPKASTVKVTNNNNNKGTNSGHNNSPKFRTNGGGIHGPPVNSKISSPRLAPPSSSTSASSNVGNGRSNRRQTKPPSIPNVAMLPPPTPPHPQNFYSQQNGQPQQQQQQEQQQPLSLTVPKMSPPMMTNENDRPSSPKRRRWSAPDNTSSGT